MDQPKNMEEKELGRASPLTLYKDAEVELKIGIMNIISVQV